MKKFKIFYIAVIIFSIIMIFTKGFDENIFIYSYNDADIGRIDGFQGNVFLSILNCFVVAIIIILTIIMTFNKNNKINIKWLLLSLTILLALSIPIGIHSYSGGIAGITAEQNIYLWNIAFYFIWNIAFYFIR